MEQKYIKSTKWKTFVDFWKSREYHAFADVEIAKM